jgi:3D (Asp-Asp-Asp) domain-containing protein
MKKIDLCWVKGLFLDLLVGVLGGLLFFGVLFALAEPFMSKGDCVYAKEENANLSQNNENKAVVVIAEENEPVQETIPEQPKRISLGEFKLTAYCGEDYHHICNDGDANITSTGVKPVAGRTIAVDPDVIPYGTVVYINGEEYIAEDCGGAIKGNRIDIYFENHQDALDFGVQYANVEVDAK